jgi:hypothetical protein
VQLIKLSESTAARRNIYFFVADVLNPSAAKTGLTFAAADIQVTQNGGSPANSAGSVTEVSSSNSPGLYVYAATSTEAGALGPLTLYCKHASMVAKYVTAQVVSIDPYTVIENQVWDALPSNHTVASSFGEQIQNVASTAASGSTTTNTVTNLTATDTDKYKDCWLAWLSGNNKDEVHLVTAYNGTTKALTHAAFSHAAASTDRFVLIQK